MQFAPLVDGDRIAIVSPADWLERGLLEDGCEALRLAGFEPIVDPQNHQRWGRMAGKDEARLEAIHRAYADPTIKAILCSRGGYGSARIADRLDFDLIRANPKPLIGYSDLTALLLSIHEATGQQPWHGPILRDFAKTLPFGCDQLVRRLLGEPDLEGMNGLLRQARTLRPGKARGSLIGGNLSLLSVSIGTGRDFDTAGKLLFIEDVDEAMYAFDRMLTHLRQAGKLTDIAGLIIGEPVAISQQHEDFPFDFNGLVAEHFADAPYPVVIDFPCAHGGDRMVMPMGGMAELEAGDAGVRLNLEF
ncbi:MAG: LD-carboxypeptidase [Pseudomonadota bacterium]